MCKTNVHIYTYQAGRDFSFSEQYPSIFLYTGIYPEPRLYSARDKVFLFRMASEPGKHEGAIDLYAQVMLPGIAERICSKRGADAPAGEPVRHFGVHQYHEPIAEAIFEKTELIVDDGLELPVLFVVDDC